jgi:NADPH2:quinone reductase
MWEDSLRALASGGRLVTYGATTGSQAELDLRRVFWKQLQIIGTTMASRTEFREMLDAAWARRFTPVIDSKLPLRDLRNAHERLEAGNHFGKIVMVPDG